MADQPHPAHLVKKVVVGYDLNALPPSLVRCFTLLGGRLARKRFRIEVVLRPLSQLPSDTDVLFVPAELVEAARQLAPESAWVAPLNAATTQQAVFGELLLRLEVGQEIYALRIEVVSLSENKVRLVYDPTQLTEEETIQVFIAVSGLRGGGEYCP